MRLFRRYLRGFGATQTHALSHPLRLRIMEIHQREKGRLTSVNVLTTILLTTPGCEHVTKSQVNYHRNRLLDAGLLPR